MKKECKIIAYFDFDGTLSIKDTLVPFLIYCVGYLKFIFSLPRIIPIITLYGLKIVNNQEAKERTLTVLLKGRSHQEITEKAKSFAYTHLNKYLVPNIYAKLEWHREQGHEIALVSANLAIYLRYFAKLHLIDHVIATEIEFKDDQATGRLATPNCYGPEKVIRITEYQKQHKLCYDYSYGYGNSRGDYEMLKSVDEAHFVVDGEFEEFELAE